MSSSAKPPRSSTASNETLDVPSFIDGRRMSGYQKLVVFLCVAVLVLDGFDSGLIAYVAPALMKELHLPKEQLGALFSAGLTGLTIGAFLCVSIADKIGRKSVLIGSTAAFGGFTLLSAFVHDFNTIVALRFVVGLGLGGAGPTAMALIAEVCPRSRRSSLLAYLGCGIPIGGIIAGAIATRLIPDFGSTGMFIAGGAMPIALLLAIGRWVPDSARFLLMKRNGQDRLRKVMRRIAPESNFDGVSFSVEKEQRHRAMILELFAGGLVRSTLFLWLASFSMLVVVSFVTNWLPTLLQSASHSLGETSLLLSFFLFGSPVGSLLIGGLMDRYNRQVCLAISAVIAALALFTIGNLVSDVAPTAALIAIGGASCGACITGASILASFMYPAAVRATGIGFTVGWGRLGSIFGSMSGTFLLGWGMSLPSLLKMAALPCGVAFVCFLGMYFTARSSLRTDPHMVGDEYMRLS